MPLDWSNERYIRFYTRDTDEWLVLPWQSRAAWPLIMRKADRSGFITAKLGARGVAVMIGLPAEVVEPAIAGLLEDGCLTQVPGGYFIPNFLAAQEARSSDAQRQRDSRERRRTEKMQESVSRSQNVTDASRPVTVGHDWSQPVTPCLAVPSVPENSHSARDPAVPSTVDATHAPSAGELVEHARKRLQAVRSRLDPSAQMLPAMAGVSETELVRRLSAYPPSERRTVLDRVLDAAISLAEEKRSVNSLYFGAIATEKAWEFLLARGAPLKRAGPARASPHRYTAADELAAVFERGELNLDAFNPDDKEPT